MNGIKIHNFTLAHDKNSKHHFQKWWYELALKLIAIDFLKNKDDYEINLIFNNNSYIALTTETIEVRLEDQSEIKD